MLPLQFAAICSLTCLALLALTGRLDFMQREFSAPWRRVVAALLFGGILTIVVFYPLAGGSRLIADDVDEVWFPAVFAGHALLLLFLVTWRALRQVRFTPRSFPFDHIAADLRHGVALGLAGWAITIAVTMGVAGIAVGSGVGPSPPQEIPPLIAWMAALPLTRKLLIIVAAMTVEELFFRGFLQRRVGLVLSSVLFTLAHASYGLPFMMVSVLTISLLIGRALQQRGRLLPCIVAHGVFDAIQLLIILPWAVRMIGGES